MPTENNPLYGQLCTHRCMYVYVSLYLLIYSYHSNLYVYICVDHSTITGGEDYEPGPFNITIPAGNISTSFNVSIMNDNIFETDESFNVLINSSYFPSGVLLQSDCILRVTIVNDESELLSFDLKI